MSYLAEQVLYATHPRRHPSGHNPYGAYYPNGRLGYPRYCNDLSMGGESAMGPSADHSTRRPRSSKSARGEDKREMQPAPHHYSYHQVAHRGQGELKKIPDIDTSPHRDPLRGHHAKQFFKPDGILGYPRYCSDR